MNRYAHFSLRATGIAILGVLACSVLPARSDAASNDNYLNQYFESGGIKIHYVEKGAGEPLVLIPALGGTVEDWINADAFTLPYHTLVLDGRASDASVSAAGEDVVRLLDRLRIPRAHVVGYANGGEVVEYLSKFHPDRLLTAAAACIPSAAVPQRDAVEWLPSEPGGTIPDARFMRSLALFLHSHPMRRRLWESANPGL